VFRDYIPDTTSCTDQSWNGTQHTQNRSESVNAEGNISQYENFVFLHTKLGGHWAILNKKPVISCLSAGLFSSIEIKKYGSPVLPKALIEQR
tara:strand:+ start:314 stop:589 length:276 start_codon:yes stop_codon:yes gene_type:complete